MDEIDRKIAFELMNDSSQSTRKIAAKLGLSISSVHRRKKRMEKEGTIRSYRAVLDMKKLGFPIGMLVSLNTQEGHAIDENRLEAKLKALSGVIRVWKIRSGSWDMMIEAWTEDMEASNELVSKIKKMKEIEEISVSYIIEES